MASGCTETALATTNQNPNFARKLITYARKLISDFSQSDILFGTSSLADDVHASSSAQSYQPDEGSSSNSADSGIIGGLRSPQLPSLSDEGSGMVWNGKGVAPIVKSSSHARLVADNSSSTLTIQSQAVVRTKSTAITYMVVFQDAVPTTKIEQLCSSADAKYGFNCTQIFTKTFKGFATTTSQEQLQVFLTAVQGMVQYAREDEAIQLQTVSVESLTVKSVGEAESAGLWGLDRIDQKSGKRDYLYHYSYVGTGVHVYTVDTGINPYHEEFYDSSGNSRVGTAYSYDTTEYNDCNGHGTHITGTMAGLHFGIAKDANIHSVRVMDCDGEGAMSDIVAGLEWILDNLELPAVVLMSIGGDATLLLDKACEALVSAGAIVVVAAGNNDEDACLLSPARDAAVITVAAINKQDAMPSFSDGGVCVDLLGPGYQVLSAYYGSDTGTAVLSGTSMAAPHIAGIAALYLEAYPSAAAYQVRASILSSATWGAISADDLYTDTPNAIGNSLLSDPLVTMCVSSGADYINITESNARDPIFITVALASKPTGVVTVTITTVDSADRLSVPQGNQVLTFTSSNYATAQPVMLTVVRNRPAGWNQFDLDFFVSAPKTAAIDDSHHKMVVFDTRQVPGDTAAFPALIIEIPFTGTGDTTYYADDYTITTCTDSSGISETIGSPDYVYAFQPLQAVTVNISLCESSFDTKLILFEETDDSGDLTLLSCNDDACDSQSWLQATLKADVTYFFVVDGFDGAYGVWQFTLEALDNSSIEGSLLSGPYGLAVAGTSSTNTTSSSNTISVDLPMEPQLVNVDWGVCECNQSMQDVSHNCQGQYNLLPMSQCADTAVTPLGYKTCNGSCYYSDTDHYLYKPWGSCSATCGGGVQTRTGSCLTSSGTATTGCTKGTFSRSCNTAPCSPTAWLVGQWGACSKTCADSKGPGTQTRTVACYQYTDSNTTTKGTFCNVPSTCDGVALADGTCCLYELSRSGVCCEVVDNDMECCESGVLDAAGVCQGTAVSLDYNGQTCTGALDATGACCDGVVDNFGVCNGYDASGIFQVTLAEGSSTTAASAALGLDSSGLTSASEAATNITSSLVSALSLESASSSVASRKLQHFGGATSRAVSVLAGSLRRLQASLADEGDTIAYIASSTTANSTSMLVYDIAAASATSAAITSAALTFGQAQLLLSDATALDDVVLAIAAVAVCGNGVCELGERPNATAAGVNATGLELASDMWAWYWYLIIAVVGDLVLATIVYISYRWWNRRHNAQTAAASEQSKLGNAAVPTAGRAPVHLTASAAAGQPVSNPYYNRSFAPAPGLQQPLQSTYAYPGSAAR
ncbi:TPA: hypothetical protein ACH3X1_000798 [Trebouxia sp. C0004]